MAYTNADLLALKAELTNNPLALSGYMSLVAANDEANANALNLVRNETKVDRESIPATEIFVNIDRDEYVALALADRQWLDSVTSSGSVNPQSNNEVREGILQLFAAGTESRTNLLAIMQEPASRATQLYKLGTLSVGQQVTPSDVANCRSAV